MAQALDLTRRSRRTCTKYGGLARHTVRCLVAQLDAHRATVARRRLRNDLEALTPSELRQQLAQALVKPELNDSANARVGDSFRRLLDPELIEQHAPLNAPLVVGHAFGYESNANRIHEP
jgi:hypothetical protein